MNGQHDIAVTGIGVLCALGVGFEEFAAALFEGEPALEPWEGKSADDPGKGRQAGRLPDFDLKALAPAPKTYLDPHSRAALGAVALALSDARRLRFDEPFEDGEATGLLLGTEFGNHVSMARFFADAALKGPRLVKPFLFQHTYANTSISLCCMEWGLRGPHQLFASGGVASGQAMTDALDRLREGRTECMAAGGVDVLGDAVFRALSARPEEDMPPLGEAAIVLVLERLETARRRNAPVRALLAGAGLASSHDPARGADAVERAILAALKDAGVGAEVVGAVCVSFTGRKARDAALVAGIARSVFAAREPNFRSLPLVAPAPLCGDPMGAVDALLAATACALVETGRTPIAPVVAGDWAPELPCGLYLPETSEPPLSGADGAPVLTASLDGAGNACALVLRSPGPSST